MSTQNTSAGTSPLTSTAVPGTALPSTSAAAIISRRPPRQCWPTEAAWRRAAAFLARAAQLITLTAPASADAMAALLASLWRAIGPAPSAGVTALARAPVADWPTLRARQVWWQASRAG